MEATKVRLPTFGGAFHKMRSRLQPRLSAPRDLSSCTKRTAKDIGLCIIMAHGESLHHTKTSATAACLGVWMGRRFQILSLGPCRKRKRERWQSAANGAMAGKNSSELIL